MTTHKHTTDYFQGHRNYFWRWAEQGNVLEFANERTICYREDLTNILKELPNTTSFSLGSILLILCACKDNWETVFDAKAVLMEIRTVVEDESAERPDHFFKMKAEAYDFLCLVNGLPSKFRSDMNRTALLQCIFDAIKVKGYHMGLLPLLTDFNSGEMDEEIFGKMQPLVQSTLVQDFAPLAAALDVFKITDNLEMKLRTGLAKPPAPISLPPIEPISESLIAQLENDESTKNIAGLAKRIMAALYIPTHLEGRDNHSFGGISDISNKGTYDKLLLSELAHDDLLLTARLANNEALFLQREAVPEHKTKELGLLIDSTLKMWGASRIYAIATAVAFHESKQEHQALKVWSLGGTDASVHHLEAKEDVVKLLEQMDISSHCGETLLQTTKNLDKNGQYILVTSPHFLSDPTSAAYLNQVREQLDYLVTVSSSGHIQMTQFHKRRSKLIHEAKIDLDRLLPSKINVNTRISQRDLPNALYQEPFPLYFPTSKVRQKQNELYHLGKDGVAAVSLDRRLLYWSSSKFGAVELMTNLPVGKYCLGGLDQSLNLMVILDDEDLVKIFNIDLKTGLHSVTEVLVASRATSALKFINGYFSFTNNKKVVLIDPRSGEVVPEINHQILAFKWAKNHLTGSLQLKKYINNGYSVISSSKTIYIHSSGKIFSDKREFGLVYNEFCWEESETVTIQLNKPSAETILTVDHMPNIKFTKFSWANGSTAVVDSRGLLHLKSHRPEVPEICIVMVIDQPTACWSSDGYVSGSRYFVGYEGDNHVGTAQFYERYIQRFIDNLK